MKQLFLFLFIGASLISCKEDRSGKKFNVTGTVVNNTAKMVYLERVPPTDMDAMIVTDSATLGKDGKFSLNAATSDATLFNIRLDKNQYPAASVINDTDRVKLTIELAGDNHDVPDKYEVEGSPASARMKNFLFNVNNDLFKVYAILMRADTLKGMGTPDSLMVPLQEEHQALVSGVRDYVLKELSTADNPALILFEIGYYQSTANRGNLGLHPITNGELKQILDAAAQKYPNHQMLAAIRSSMEADIAKMEERTTDWVGKDAPDFTIPDVNGKQVSLSSFRGKYVLVDFWASWCGPCRAENPNLVKAYATFRDSNFTILGVSLDHPGEKDKWVKAIMKDNLTWPQVSELNDWQSDVVALYGIKAIPFNVLVDPAGKVVAQNLGGGGLEFKLREVLK